MTSRIAAPLLLALALAVSPSMASAQVVGEVSGSWALDTDNAENRIDGAIEDVTSEMSFFLRPIATSRLDGMINPNQTLRVREDGDDVLFTMDDWTVRLPLDGPAIRTEAPDGTSLRIRASRAHDQLVIQQAAEDGTRVIYLSRRGDQLLMSARVQSDRLPNDVTYRLRYRRS